MTEPRNTTGERLARIETLLEGLAEMKDDLKAIRKDLDDDKAALEKLKNRGTGILIGVGLIGGGVGAGLVKFWAALIN